MMMQMSIEEAMQMANLHIDRVEKNSDSLWKVRALECLKEVAKRQELFNADDVEAELSKHPEQTHEKRAMGAIFRSAARDGVITATDTFTPSKNPKSHACPRRVWRSCIIGL